MSALDFDRFVEGDWPASDFGHARHIEAAYLALDRLPFAAACETVRTGIRRTAERAGAADKYNETITLAAMALVAEKMGGTRDFAAFAASNPALFRSDFLAGWYSPERLHSAAARHAFLLPDRAPDPTGTARAACLETSQ